MSVIQVRRSASGAPEQGKEPGRLHAGVAVRQRPLSAFGGNRGRSYPHCMGPLLPAHAAAAPKLRSSDLRPSGVVITTRVLPGPMKKLSAGLNSH